MIAKDFDLQRMTRLGISIFVFLFVVAVSNVSALQTNNFVIHKFASCIDGKEDCYALTQAKTLTKNNKINQNETLIVYMHSLGGDYNEPYKPNNESSLAGAIAKEYPTAPFVSLNYGSTPSWGNAAARVDITNNLNSLVKELKIKKIVFVGNSMGATAALTYASTAPSSIKNKIIGIIAIDPCANLEDLYKQSNDPQVKTSLEAAFGASANDSPTIYQQNSFDSCLAFLPVSIKVGIISASADTVIPIALQKDVIRDLSNRNINIKVNEIEGKSDPLPVKTIIEHLHFVME